MSSASVLGLGKLGTPVAVAMATVHDVMGYDVNPSNNKKRKYEHLEQGFVEGQNFQDIFDNSSLKFASSLEELVSHGEIIFIAVQTPHEARLDGSVRFSYGEAKDFDYSYLIKACRDIVPYVKPHQTVAVISTVLPGTIRRLIYPILGRKCKLVYNPYFIAMGTVLRDFQDPEFILMGGEEKDMGSLIDYYGKHYDYYSGWSPTMRLMSWESAELTKLAYNSFISSKIVAINTIAEMAHGIPHANIDDVSYALESSTKRLSSRRYMRGGVGDGGSCHIRDSISLSFLAERLGVSYNLFSELLWARELQATYLVKLFRRHSGDLPKVLLGKSFKEESNITTGSCALLIADILRHDAVSFEHYDPYVDSNLPKDLYGTPKAYFITTKHAVFKTLKFPKGSIVFDPFRFIKDQPGVTVVRFGIGE